MFAKTVIGKERGKGLAFRDEKIGKFHRFFEEKLLTFSKKSV
jgi:hypothetical protein